MEYLLQIIVLVGVYTIVALSLDLLAGHAGILSVCQAAFFGIGAYASALLTTGAGASFLTGMAAGMVAAALISVVISLPSMRLHEDYFIVATMGFQLIIFDIFNNWIEVTKGPYGITEIPRPSIFGFAISTGVGFAALAAFFTLLSYLMVVLITTSPFGRVLRAIREDEVFARSLGKSTTSYKLTAYAVSAMLAAMAGSLFAHYYTYIEPSNFTISESILFISMVIIGGMGSAWGALAGAAILVTLPEGLRFLGLLSPAAANVRQIIYGLLLILMMMLRPQGLFGGYGFKRVR